MTAFAKAVMRKYRMMKTIKERTFEWVLYLFPTFHKDRLFSPLLNLHSASITPAIISPAPSICLRVNTSSCIRYANIAPKIGSAVKIKAVWAAVVYLCTVF